MAKNVVFDEQSAARIARSVKWTEQFTDPTDGDPLGETDLAGEANPGGTETAELSTVEPTGNLTLISETSASGEVVTGLSGTVVTAVSGKVVTGLSGTVVIGVKCDNGNLVVTTESLSNLASTATLGNLSSNATLANLSTSANLSDLVTSSNLTVSLADFASVTTQNYTLPLQGE